MEQVFVDFLKGFDVQTIISIAAVVWFLLKPINKKLEKHEAIFDKHEKIFERIDMDIKEIRKSINRMEGAFYSKDCCMLKDDRKIEKVD